MYSLYKLVLRAARYPWDTLGQRKHRQLREREQFHSIYRPPSVWVVSAVLQFPVLLWYCKRLSSEHWGRIRPICADSPGGKSREGTTSNLNVKTKAYLQVQFVCLFTSHIFSSSTFCMLVLLWLVLLQVVFLLSFYCVLQCTHIIFSCITTNNNLKKDKKLLTNVNVSQFFVINHNYLHLWLLTVNLQLPCDWSYINKYIYINIYWQT